MHGKQIVMKVVVNTSNTSKDNDVVMYYLNIGYEICTHGKYPKIIINIRLSEGHSLEKYTYISNKYSRLYNC